MPLQAMRESPPVTCGRLNSDELIARQSKEYETSTRNDNNSTPS